MAVAVAAVGTMLLNLPAAKASTFGTRAYVYKEQGSEVDILVPSTTPAPAEHEFVLHRVVVQSDYGSTPGLVQAGLFYGPSLGLDNCGMRSSWTYFTEYKSAGSSNELSSYHCNFFQTATPGENTLQSVYHKVANTAEWNAAQNFTTVGTYKVNFESAFPAVGGEIQRVNEELPVYSHTSAYYANAPVWSSFTEPNRGGQFPITNPAYTELYVPNVGWTVPNVPTPFTITH